VLGEAGRALGPVRVEDAVDVEQQQGPVHQDSVGWHPGGMGWYGDRVLPRIVDRSLGERTTGPLRERVCAGLTGEVVEIGFGSGGNVPHYPAAVRGVAAVEPSGPCTAQPAFSAAAAFAGFAVI